MAGRKSSSMSNPAGKASRPRGGKKIAIKSSGTSSTAVYSGSSGKATKVGAKQK